MLRPLVGLDKQEIIAIAERAGTFEISILPHQDSCSFLQPQHPATRTTAAACEEAETPIDVEAWARRLQHEAFSTAGTRSPSTERLDAGSGNELLTADGKPARGVATRR